MAHSTVIGIDLGGTKIAAARYSTNDWTVEEQLKIHTEADQGFSHVQERLADVIEQLRTDSTTGVGIGVPGLVKQPEGVIVTLPNIPGAEDSDLGKKLYEATGLPCNIDNDVNCFALAEASTTACKDHRVIVAVMIGTGVGGGIVINGQLFHGNNGLAGEVGHMLLQPGQPPYESEDQRGEVEQFLSGTAMEKRCPQATDPSQYLEGDTCSFMHDDIFKEVAWMCTNTIHLLDPGVIVFGGSAGLSIGKHFPEIEKELTKWLLPGTPVPELKLAELDDASTRGAALLLLHTK